MQIILYYYAFMVCCHQLTSAYYKSDLDIIIVMTELQFPVCTSDYEHEHSGHVSIRCLIFGIFLDFPTAVAGFVFVSAGLYF